MDDSDIGMKILLAVGLFVVLIVFGFIAISRVRAERVRIAEMKLAYERALAFLQGNPGDPNARVQCLELGRAYYGATIPDVQIEQYGEDGHRGVSSVTNNTAGREARIQADIEARIGHLKIAQR